MGTFRDRLLSVTQVIVAIPIFAMMVVTAIDVVGRYIFGKPLYGATEMIQILLALSVFAAMVLTAARDKHISVTLFTPRIRRRFPRAEPLVMNVISFIGLGVICYGLYKVGGHAIEARKTTIVLEWPIAAIAFTCLFFAVVAAILQLGAKGEGDD